MTQQHHLRVVAKAIGLLAPAASGLGVVAILYDPASPASRQNAHIIAGYVVDGLKTQIVDRAMSLGLPHSLATESNPLWMC